MRTWNSFILLIATALLALPAYSQTSAQVISRPKAAAQIQHSVALSWLASSSVGATYNLYRGATCPPAQTAPIASAISGLTYTDSTVVNGSSYAYAVSALTTAGGESAESNCLSVLIPAQTSPPGTLSGVVN